MCAHRRAQQEFMHALKKVSASVGVRDIEKFQKWMDEFGAM